MIKILADLVNKYDDRDAQVLEACEQAKKELREGDIIFIEVDHPVFQKIADTTLGWTNHVGIAFIDENGGWCVAESAIPLSRRCSLYDFLKKSRNAYFQVKRLKSDLQVSDVEKLKLACDKRMRVPYHLGFDYHSKRLYCSKFVYDVFKDALGIEIGRFESFKDLLSNNPEGPVHFWRIWFLGKIPWERTTVTPQSQFDDSQLSTVLNAWQP